MKVSHQSGMTWGGGREYHARGEGSMSRAEGCLVESEAPEWNDEQGQHRLPGEGGGDMAGARRADMTSLIKVFEVGGGVGAPYGLELSLRQTDPTSGSCLLLCSVSQHLSGTPSAGVCFTRLRSRCPCQDLFQVNASRPVLIHQRALHCKVAFPNNLSPVSHQSP